MRERVQSVDALTLPELVYPLQVRLPALPADTVDYGVDVLPRQPHIRHLPDLRHCVGELAAGGVEALHRYDDLRLLPASGNRQVARGGIPAAAGEARSRVKGKSELPYDRLGFVLDASPLSDCARRSPAGPE